MRIGFCDLEYDAVASARMATHLREPDAADLLHGPLRAPVLWADKKDDGLDELEGVPQHQRLHLAVVEAAPVCSRQERPSNLDLASPLVVAVVPGRADDAPRRPIDDGKRPSRFHRLAEECPEDVVLVAIAGRVQFPDAGI